MRGQRTTLTRYRFGGAATISIARAWVLIFAPAFGAPELLARGGVIKAISGRIALDTTADVNVRDVLRDDETSRLYLVNQIVDDGESRVALVAELHPHIPDEFEFGVIEKFWTAAGGSFSISGSVGELICGPAPVAAWLSAGAQLYQSVAGDFDVYAQLGAYHTGADWQRTMLGCRDANGQGAYIGLKASSAGNTVIRVDEVLAGVTEIVTTSHTLNSSASSYYFFRVRREGAVLHAYYSPTPEPRYASDWVEVVSANPWASGDAVRLGFFAQQQTTPSAQHGRAAFLRNWIGT